MPDAHMFLHVQFALVWAVFVHEDIAGVFSVFVQVSKRCKRLRSMKRYGVVRLCTELNGIAASGSRIDDTVAVFFNDCVGL